MNQSLLHILDMPIRMIVNSSMFASMAQYHEEMDVNLVKFSMKDPVFALLHEMYPSGESG